MNLFLEAAKLRAARVLWSEMMTELGATDPRAKMLRTHCQTSGVSLTEQDPYNNVVRTTLEALAAVLGGTQSLHTNGFDEAIALPSDEAARIARNTQLILQHESRVTDVVDPLGGSYYVEALTVELIDKARDMMETIEAKGGMTAAVAAGGPKLAIETAATQRQAKIDRGEEVIVGVNRFRSDSAGRVTARIVDTARVRAEQIATLEAVRRQRNEPECRAILSALREYAAMNEGNLLDAAIAAARARATLGEITEALEDIYGRHVAATRLVRGVYGEAYQDDPEYSALSQRIAQFSEVSGGSPAIYIAKLGQDGHDRGAKVIASAFADLGLSVYLGDLFETPQEAAAQADALGVDAVGVSSLAAGHATLVPELLAALAERERAEVAVVVGGIVPQEDQAALREAGVAEIFGPGTNVLAAAFAVLDCIEGRRSNR